MAHSSPRAPARASYSALHAVYFDAAVLAAHGARPQRDGFRASDVRFFFLLFRNWVEHDLLDPGQDIDLTQVRRALERLVGVGHAQAFGKSVRGRSGGRTVVLTSAGMIALAEALAGGSGPRSFESDLFLVTFATCYRGLLAKRAPKRVNDLLDPVRLHAAAERRAVRLVADLEERVRSSVALAASAKKARARGATNAQMAARIESEGAYQLHRVRPLAQLLLSLPVDVQTFELDHGMATRARLLFAPMLERAHKELASLRALSRDLRA